MQLKNVNLVLNTLNEDIKKINIKLNNLLDNNKIKTDNINLNINTLASPGEGVTVFTSPYLSAGAPALGEVKGLILLYQIKFVIIINVLFK